MDWLLPFIRSLHPVQQIIIWYFFIGLSLSFFYGIVKKRTITLGSFGTTVLPMLIALFIFLHIRDFKFSDNMPVLVLALLLTVMATLWFLYSMRHLTLTNSDDFWFARKKTAHQFLVTTGPYRYMRNPLTVSMMVSYLGFTLAFFHPVTAILYGFTVMALVVTVFAEEHFLSGLFLEYEAYKKRTGRFLPRLHAVQTTQT